MPKIAVAIPTFRRPKSLRRLLEAVAALDTQADVTVIAADNDAEGHGGVAVCEAMAQAYRWPLTALAVPERGIAQVRNALVAAALADPAIEFVAMIDDDEWPEPQWLEAFLATQAATGADALQGSIRFAVETGEAQWRERFDGIANIRHATGPVAMLEGAGNLFVARGCLEALPRPWFDPAFALSGGEDRDFFVRLKQAGCRFAWCDEALANTLVPDVRLNLRWALNRAYSIGNSDMRVLLKHDRSLRRRATEGAKIAGAFTLAPALLLAGAFDAAARADSLRRVYRAAGKLHAMIGGRYEAYRVPHGD